MKDNSKEKSFLSEDEKEYFGIYETGISAQELEFYSTPPGKKFLETEQLIYNTGLENYLSLSLPTKKEAGRLPKKTKEEMLYKEKMLRLAKETAEARKIVSRYYKDGLKEFDPNVFDLLNRASESTEKDIENAKKALLEAREKGDSSAEEKAKKELRKSRDLIATIKKQLKKAKKVSALYRKAAAPYLEAKRLVLTLKSHGQG